MHMTLRSSTKKMVDVTEEMKIYFKELIQPLATNLSILQMFKEFKSEMVEKFERRFEEQSKKIEELESRLAVRENTEEKSKIKIDDVE